MDFKPSNPGVAQLLAEQEKCTARMRLLNDGLRALRGLCDHDMRSIGHTHKEHYQCEKCGVTETQ